MFVYWYVSVFVNVCVCVLYREKGHCFDHRSAALTSVLCCVYKIQLSTCQESCRGQQWRNCEEQSAVK